MDLLEMAILSSSVSMVLCCHGIPIQHFHNPCSAPVTMVTTSNHNNNHIISVTLSLVIYSTNALYQLKTEQHKMIPPGGYPGDSVDLNVTPHILT